MFNKSDFIAELKFETTENGGRKTPVQSNYRPDIEFENYRENWTSGQQTYIGKEIVYPGETINAEIKITGTEYFSGRLFEGMKFEFSEGSRIIGFGKIIKITNQNLKSNTETNINLNLYPKDILKKIEVQFGESSGEIIWKFQGFIKKNKSFRSARIIRAILYLSNGNEVQIEKHIKQAETDWRDILLWAEYDENDNQIRDFNNEFGNENKKSTSNRVDGSD